MIKGIFANQRVMKMPKKAQFSNFSESQVQNNPFDFAAKSASKAWFSFHNRSLEFFFQKPEHKGEAQFWKQLNSNLNHQKSLH